VTGNRILPRGLAAATALLLAVGVAGCSDPNLPSDIPTPEISWDPAPPEIPDDPFAQVVFDYLVASALANNVHDFSIEQLSAVATEGRIIAMYENFLEDHVSSHKDFWQVQLGPAPFVFGEITTRPDGGAEVAICYASRDRWEISVKQPEPHVSGDKTGTVLTFVLVTEDGVPKVSGTTGVLSECDATGVSYGTFAELPQTRDNLSESDVRPPIGYESGAGQR
jgi:hypothetical protein